MVFDCAHEIFRASGSIGGKGCLGWGIDVRELEFRLYRVARGIVRGASGGRQRFFSGELDVDVI